MREYHRREHGGRRAALLTRSAAAHQPLWLDNVGADSFSVFSGVFQMRKLLILAILLMAPSCFAGNCPSGANYLNVRNPTAAKVTLSGLGITNCFFIAANGSDSNTGADESHAWLHAPGMTTCTRNCASNTPSGGSGYIFRGGDTWHFGNSGASVYTNGWTWTWSGTSQSIPIYIGVDPNWYSRASWSRPILTGDNTTNACPGAGPCAVASCTHEAIAGSKNNVLVSFGGLKWNILDNFEFTGLCWNSSLASNAYVNFNSGSQGVITPYFFVAENLYIHGWTYTAAGTQNAGVGISGNSSYGGAVIQFNVVDGQDSDDHAFSPLGPNNDDAYILRYNVFRRVGGDQVMSDCHYIHDNLFEYWNFETDRSGHGDLIFCEGTYAGGSSNPNLFFNNVFRYVGTTYGVNISYVLDLGTRFGQTDYIFNNVFHQNQVAPGGGGNYFSDEGRSGNWLLFNNTGEVPKPNGAPIMQAQASAITSINDHWIVTPATQGSIFAGGTPTENHAIYMTNATAATQGYTSSNDYQPMASGNSTVGAGANETSGYCADSVLHDAEAEAACKRGITGVSYNSTNHSVTYPGIAANARPSTGAWDVGAYQFTPRSAQSSLRPTLQSSLSRIVLGGIAQPSSFGLFHIIFGYMDGLLHRQSARSNDREIFFEAGTVTRSCLRFLKE